MVYKKQLQYFPYIFSDHYKHVNRCQGHRHDEWEALQDPELFIAYSGKEHQLCNQRVGAPESLQSRVKIK